MSILRMLSLGALVTISLSVEMAEAGAPKPVAVVYALKGEATLAIPGSPRRSLRLFDRFPAGTTLEVGPNSRLVLTFMNRRCYELGQGSRVTLGPKDLTSQTGSVRHLTPFPSLPLLPPIAKDDHPGPKTGAVTLRSETISGLYPDRGVTSLASAVRLHFDPVPSAPKYHIQIVDQKGTALFSIDTQATDVSVPSKLLSPGRVYFWSVETRDRPGTVARGEATLVTLDADQVRAREKLQRWIQQSGIADDLGLLEGVDRALGLREAPPQIDESSTCPFSSPGVVIETVTPESAAFRAGLMPGDRLSSWCRTSSGESECATRGDLRTPFDWLDLQMEEVQRGGIVVEGVRGPEIRRWSLLPAIQGITVVPFLQGALAESYQISRDREKAGDPASAGLEIERAAALADENHCADAALWLRARVLQLQAKARKWPEVDAGYQAILAKAHALGAARVEEQLQISWADALISGGEATKAQEQIEGALRQEEKDHPESLGVVALLTRLGSVAANLRDNPGEADRLYRRAYDLALRIAPGGGAEASTTNNLTISTFARGDLEQAERYAARALAIREKLTPSGDAITPSLVSYGNVLYARRDFAGAEAAFLRARKILEKLKPDSIELAKVLHNLGEIAYQRGDDDAAENLFQRELSLFEKLDPSSQLVRDSLMGLGEVELHRHQGDRAEKSWQRALEISEKLNPKGAKTAWCLGGLAEVATMQGRSKEAGELLRRALAIWEEINPKAIDTGSIHSKLGILLLEQGDTTAAEAHLRTAIRIHEENRAVFPEGYQALARLQSRKGQVKEAAASYLAAVAALESQRTRLGGAQESQWFYGSSLSDLYFEAAEQQIALSRPQEAWRLIERGRARGFQEMLAQRDLRFAGELPADLYAERRRLDSEYDRAQAALAAWLPEQGAEKMETLQGRLRDLRLEQAEIQEKIRRSSPRIASLESSTPLNLEAARSALDPGTVLLEYAVGPETTWLFALQSAGSAGPGLSVFRIASSEKALREGVESFRNLLRRSGSDRGALQTRAKDLYRLLLRPAEKQIAGARRILVSPEGPLHALPFAALMHGSRYLVEWKPIHSVLSATVYAELKKSRPAHRDLQDEHLAAFGDPIYPHSAPEKPADPEVQEARQRGWTLQRLPSTRQEVEAIAALYPHAQTYLGSEATEEKAKSLGTDSRLIHFACHGLLDERFPLNSALALTLPEHQAEGQDNGLLQAWEVFESVRLDADLVTLSACDTALGKDMGGEGLVGLTRAFQYAGARSVLASLWGVADDSTARFMKRFYGYLRSGKAKDEALRAAQIDQIREKSSSSHPFHWAAFELNGDWK